MAQSKREDFKHAIIIEEAHHILLRKKQEVTGSVLKRPDLAAKRYPAAMVRPKGRLLWFTGPA